MWQPTADIASLKARAATMASIRTFFASRKVLEVETPALSQHTITDPHLNALTTQHTQPGSKLSQALYLQTSPEYAMKRLLAAGSGDIFQICKAFRDDEVGRLHNPEFTMLEWYRINFNMQALIDEVAELLMIILPVKGVEQFTYTELFIEHCGINPISASEQEILEVCANLGLADYIESVRDNLIVNTNATQSIVIDTALQVLFNQQVESQIGRAKPTVVTHFPASQASLATLSEDNITAQRFEVYYQGIELANGFTELQDPTLQQQRFVQDNCNRSAMGLPTKPVDTLFIAALEAGLPACSGVAMGLDRLLMLALDKKHIQEVLSFSYANC